jgi:hypothetical protein
MQIFMITMQIAKPQISTKYWTTLPQNSPETCLLKRFFILEKFEFEPYTIRGLGAGGPLPTEG